MTTHYARLLERLLSVNINGGIKLGLQNTQTLDLLLNKPSQSFPSIHVAGTNGKGSVCTKIAAAYEANGFKVGLYTSPHIACFRERIRINDQLITEAQVEKHVKTLFSLCKEYDINATFFELTTLLAFMHFSAEKVNVAILETGLGGRLDATNIAKTILSIITSISLDHTEVLGETIEAITMEKAGIIKPTIPLIIGPRVSKEIIIPIALKNNSLCIQVKGEFPDYHTENCAIAQEALHLLQISEKNIKIGLEAVPACRLQLFSGSDLKKLGYQAPLPQAVILDVAHNPDGFVQLLKALQKNYPQAGFRIVMGLSSNKDVIACLNTVKSEAATFHFIEGNNERAVPKKHLERTLISLGVDKNRILCESSISSGISNAIQLAGNKNDVVVVCGSFFIMAKARQALGINEPQDPQDMNEK